MKTLTNSCFGFKGETFNAWTNIRFFKIQENIMLITAIYPKQRKIQKQYNRLKTKIPGKNLKSTKHFRKKKKHKFK